VVLMFEDGTREICAWGDISLNHIGAGPSTLPAIEADPFYLASLLAFRAAELCTKGANELNAMAESHGDDQDNLADPMDMAYKLAEELDRHSHALRFHRAWRDAGEKPASEAPSIANTSKPSGFSIEGRIGQPPGVNVQDPKLAELLNLAHDLHCVHLRIDAMTVAHPWRPEIFHTLEVARDEAFEALECFTDIASHVVIDRQPLTAGKRLKGELARYQSGQCDDPKAVAVRPGVIVQDPVLATIMQLGDGTRRLIHQVDKLSISHPFDRVPKNTLDGAMQDLWDAHKKFDELVTTVMVDNEPLLAPVAEKSDAAGEAVRP